MFEKDLPGANTTGFSGDRPSVVSQLPLETCETINGAWGWNAGDRKWKSTEELVRYLVRAAGMNANFLLNVGPQPDGRIQPEQAERLRQMGGWLKTNGEGIYGTRGGPLPPRPWGATTRKGNTVFVHVLDWPDPLLTIPALGGKVKRARALRNGAAVKIEEVAGGALLLHIPPAVRDAYATVIAIELDAR
jgi:alpha-L-fucosidase